MDATEPGAACRVGASVTVIADGDVQRLATVGDGDLDALGAAVPDRVGQRLGDDEVSCGLHRLGEPPAESQVQFDRDTAGQCQRQRLHRPGQAAIRQYRRVDAPYQVAQFGEGFADAGLRLGHQGLGAGGIGVDDVLGHAEIHGRRDEADLRAVVQITFDAA